MAFKRRTRMYEPWGYRDQNDYQGAEIIHENDLDSFFAGVEYKRDDNKIHFTNKDGDEVGSLNVNDFVKSDSIIEKTEYKDGILKIYFTNGDIVTIDLTELLDENEFKDGLIIDNHVVKVLVDANSERWLTVSPDGVKVSGIQAEIDRLDERIDNEISRAISAETVLDEKIDQEIADRIADVDAEETRATGEETRIDTKLNGEITRATQTEQALDNKINTLNSEIDSEERRAEAAEQEIRTLLTNEIGDRKADVNEEETRAKAAEQALQDVIDAEEARALSAETDLQAAISGKADADSVYTQEEVDALLASKESEIFSLKKIVGELGGNVTYEYPTEGTVTSLLGNNGTVKLTEDATIGRFGPGITAKNKVKLNLNSHDITSTSAGSYGAIMSRGTQEITIYGKGTIDSLDGICIEANGENSVINLTGSTTVYQNDRSGGELIYCYAGTINITNGTFKNLGENKGYMLNCYDANYAAGKANIIVTGGKFYDFNPADNNAEGEHTSFVPEGYHVETSTDGESTVYTVKKD